ncbi:hypothetical protein [Kitasatospora sp. NPDC091207]|uniref:hypothetical protein n=1 Tax=Kitasatospora sp. NPDC091207 TaxID=3364083 RepID=UPI0037F1FCA5
MGGVDLEVTGVGGVAVAPDARGRGMARAVYGLTSKRDPVVLDARTGEDRETAPGASPYLVDEYVALAGDGLYLSVG